MIIELLAALSLVPQPVQVVEKSGFAPKNAVVRHTVDAAVPAEGYRLSVTGDGIVIASSDAAGRFYAEKTLGQLACAEGYPCVEISDAPAYPWRGVLIDEARHFLGKVTVKRVIDQMALHKMNVLHWHLTDDQGWRIDVPGFPDLVKYGSVRPSSVPYGARVQWIKGEPHGELDGVQYGPYYYTEADLREIVAYAAERHVRIVPEVEVPGHAYALLAAYPQFACRPENLAKRTPRCMWGIEKDVLCVGNPEAIRFYEKIFDYVCSVFPSDVIHIGGDECPRVRWEKCPKCQAFIREHDLKGVDGLQSWVTRHFADYLAKKGKRILGWDEYLAGDVPKDAIGMSWRMTKKGGAGTAFVSATEIAARGHDIVMTPTAFCYHDYSQGLEDDPYLYHGNRIITLEKAYAFNPTDGIAPEHRKHVLGGQSNCWGEDIWCHFDLEWKMWPRACATAEVLWLGDRKPGFVDFRARMEEHRKRLMRAGVNCAPLGPVAP